MNAPVKIDPLAIPAEHVQQIIAKATALLAKPSRSGLAWLNLLCAFDVVVGSDVLTRLIADEEHDLRLGNADEPLETARVRFEAFDADQVDRSAWGLAR